MNLTPELFQQNFEIDNDTLIVSPAAAACADKLGYDFTYNRQSDEQYQTVIADVVEGERFFDAKQSHAYRWFKLALNCVKDGGKLFAKIPSYLCMKLRNHKGFNVKTVTILDDTTFVSLVKEDEYNGTVVKYPNKEIIVNIYEQYILSSYDEKHLNILNGEPISSDKVVQLHHNFEGKTAGTLIDSYNHKIPHIDHHNVLIITDGGPWRSPWKLEENPNTQTGGRAIILSDPDEVELVRSHLMTHSVNNLINNVTFNKTESLPIHIKRILSNPANIV